MKKKICLAFLMFISLNVFANTVDIEVNTNKENKVRKWIFVRNCTSMTIPYEMYGINQNEESVLIDKAFVVPNAEIQSGSFKDHTLLSDYINEFDSFNKISIVIDGDLKKYDVEFKSDTMFITFNNYKNESDKVITSEYNKKSKKCVYSFALDDSKENVDIIFAWLNKHSEYAKNVKKPSANTITFDVPTYWTKGGANAVYVTGFDCEINVKDDSIEFVFSKVKDFFHTSLCSKISKEIFDELEASE